MTTITVGTRVAFTERRTYRPYLHTVTGTVTSTPTRDGRHYAWVERDDGLMPKMVPMGRLRVVEEDTNYLQPGDRVRWVRDQAWCSGEVISVRDWRDGIYVQRGEAAQDDVQDILATHPSPFQLIADDYDEAIGLAGSMGTGVVEP